METIALEVVDIETGDVAHTVDVKGKSENHVDRVERGMLMQMDVERFFVRRVEEG